MKVNLTQDVIDNHTNEEIIAFLARTMTGITRNYKLALEKNSPAMAFSCLGDIVMCASILTEMNSRNQARLAQRQ